MSTIKIKNYTLRPITFKTLPVNLTGSEDARLARERLNSLHKVTLPACERPDGFPLMPNLMSPTPTVTEIDSNTYNAMCADRALREYMQSLEEIGWIEIEEPKLKGRKGKGQEAEDPGNDEDPKTVVTLDKK